MYKSKPATPSLKQQNKRYPFSGRRPRFIRASLRVVTRECEDAELRFLCLVGLGLAKMQGLLDTEPDIVQKINAASVGVRRWVLRQTLPFLPDEKLDAWVCYFCRIMAAHDLGEHGEAAVRLAASEADLSDRRLTYPKPDAVLYHDVHGLIDALPRENVEAIRQALHQMALSL